MNFLHTQTLLLDRYSMLSLSQAGWFLFSDASNSRVALLLVFPFIQVLQTL